MTVLPEKVSVADLATAMDCTDRTIRNRIRKERLPQTHEIRLGVTGWNRVDLEPFLASWEFSDNGERVRRAFGKPAAVGAGA